VSRRRYAVSAAVAAVLVILAFGAFGGHWLVVDDALTKADAAAVLNGSFPDRVLEAITLFQGGYAPRLVLLTARDDPDSGPAPAYWANRQVAANFGIPAEVLVSLVGRTPNTQTEARLVVQWARDGGVSRVIVVTSRWHTRRAGLIFAHEARGRPHILVQGARLDTFDAARWWASWRDAARVLSEYAKLLYFCRVYAGLP